VSGRGCRSGDTVSYFAHFFRTCSHLSNSRSTRSIPYWAMESALPLTRTGAMAGARVVRAYSITRCHNFIFPRTTIQAHGKRVCYLLRRQSLAQPHNCLSRHPGTWLAMNYPAARRVGAATEVSASRFMLSDSEDLLPTLTPNIARLLGGMACRWRKRQCIQSHALPVAATVACTRRFQAE
jgi:hypothetical protein